jgi:hypothetical protein
MARTIRYAAAAILISIELIFAAPVVRSGGYGGWLIAVSLAFGWPLLCGIVAGRSIGVVGMLASIALPSSFAIHDYVLRSDPNYHSGFPGLVGCAGFSILLGVIGTAGAYAGISPRLFAHRAKGGASDPTGRSSGRADS